MEHATLSGHLTDIALDRLDRLIAEVARLHHSPSELLVEHLKSARNYLLGAMPNELEFSLIAAKGLAAQLPDVHLQGHVKQEITGLLGLAAVPAPPPAAQAARPSFAALEEGEGTELYRFFRGTATTFGVFYPTHYIFASFPSFENAQNAARALQAAGYRDLVAAPASETLRFMNEIRADAGVWGALMASISRFFGTEEVFADIDLGKAHKGAGFLAVYCSREDQAERIRDLAMPFDPIAMQLYLATGIRSLCAGRSPGPQGNHPEENS